MSGDGTHIKGRWAITAAAAVLVLAAAGLGVAWAWPRLFPDPLRSGLDAYHRGDWRTASSFANRALAATPDDPGAIRLLARASARLGRDDSAQMLYHRLQEAHPATLQAEDFSLLAAGFVRQNQDDMARLVLAEALQRDPNHPESLNELVRIKSLRREFLEAAELAERLARQPGWEARGDVILGVVRGELFDPAGAAAALERALRRDPSGADFPIPAGSVRKLIARTRLQRERPAEARAILQSILADGPDPEAAWLLSRAWLQEGDTARAAAMLRQAGDFRPDPLTPEPAPFVGAARCGECHDSKYHTQQVSRHATTFRRGPDLAAFHPPERPRRDPDDPDVTHTFHRDGHHIAFETRTPSATLRAVVDYALGSGDRGVTPIGHDDDGQNYELRLSHYADIHGWDRTTGQVDQTEAGQDDRAKKEPALLGKRISPDTVRSCVHCHTTNFRAAQERTGPAAADHSIGCERCHGPGGNHLKAVEAEFSDLAIVQPKRATASRRVQLCAQCHSPRGFQPLPTDPTRPGNARFQGSTLILSRCFTESNGRLDCMTCHDPHRNAEPAASFYEVKCLACHGPAPSRSHDDAEAFERVACPVKPTNGCLGCHMPVVKTDLLHNPTFTDHYIRVHRGSEGADAEE